MSEELPSGYYELRDSGRVVNYYYVRGKKSWFETVPPRGSWRESTGAASLKRMHGQARYTIHKIKDHRVADWLEAKELTPCRAAV